MDLTPYVERLRTDLADAAAAGGADVQATAERLLLALDPATRLVLLEALAQAAAEISGELDHDAVEVRLSGRDPEFVVSPTSTAAPTPPAEVAPVEPEPEDAEETGPTQQTRITLRLPEPVKVRAEEAAARIGQSLNTWLVEAVRAALDGGGGRVDLRFGDRSLTITGDRPGGTSSRGKGGRIQGWVG